MISEELLDRTNKSLNSIPSEESDKIVISKRSYEAVKIFVQRVKSTGKEWQQFPNLDPENLNTINNSMNEVTNQKCIMDSRWNKDVREFRLTVDFDQLAPSKRGELPKGFLKTSSQDIPPKLSSVTTSADKPNKPLKVKNNPVSVGGYKPTFDVFKDFVDDIRSMHILRTEHEFENLSKQINDLISRLPLAAGGDQDKLIDTLQFLSQKRRACTRSSLVDAIKEVSAEGKYSRFNLEEIISTDPSDYEFQGFAA